MSATPTKPEALASLGKTGIAPRGLNRIQAAAYIGVGPTRFDWMVANGYMPKPKRVGVRGVIWDREQLDIAFAALPDIDGKSGVTCDTDIWGRAKV